MAFPEDIEVGTKLFRVVDEYRQERACLGRLGVLGRYWTIVSVRLQVFEVVKRTPCGAWVTYLGKGRELIDLAPVAERQAEAQRWGGNILTGESTWLTPRTRRVDATVEDALEAARIRRRYHVGMARQRLESAQTRLDRLEEISVDDIS